MKKTVFIGGGNMATAILGGLVPKQAASQFHVIDPSDTAAQQMAKLGITCTSQWPDGLQASCVVLAVKPQIMKEALQAIACQLHGQELLISIAAGVSTGQIMQWAGQPSARVVRAMPNTPALVGQGMTGLFFTPHCTQADKSTANTLFEACGKLIEVSQEDDINAITAISGSGPGYVFYWMEALANAAEALGFSPEEARLLTSQTVLGAASLASQSPESFATLRERVTSKGGTTFAGLEAMRAGEVAKHIELGAKAAMDRAIALQKAGN